MGIRSQRLRKRGQGEAPPRQSTLPNFAPWKSKIHAYSWVLQHTWPPWIWTQWKLWVLFANCISYLDPIRVVSKDHIWLLPQFVCTSNFGFEWMCAITCRLPDILLVLPSHPYLNIQKSENRCAQTRHWLEVPMEICNLNQSAAPFSSFQFRELSALYFVKKNSNLFLFL